MRIVIDTNVLIPELALSSRKFELFANYCKRTESLILLPDVVVDELNAYMVRSARRHAAEAIEAISFFANATGKSVSVPELPAPETVAKDYLERVKKRLGISNKQILHRRPEFLEELVSRATRRNKPFNENGEGFRDCIIWLEVLDTRQVGQASDVQVCFISKNTRDFGGNDVLHAELREEAERVGIRIQYYSSLDSFLKSHADQIAFITFDYLNAKAPVEEIENELISAEIQTFQRQLQRSFSRKYDSTASDPVLTSAQLELDDFFVYPDEDGSWSVIAYYFGDAEIEGDVFEHDEQAAWYGESPYSNVPSTIKLEVPVQVQVVVSINPDRTVKSWEMVEAEVF